MPYQIPFSLITLYTHLNTDTHFWAHCSHSNRRGSEGGGAMLLTRWTSSGGFLVYFSNGEGKKSPNIYERLLGKIFHKKSYVMFEVLWNLFVNNSTLNIVTYNLPGPRGYVWPAATACQWINMSMMSLFLFTRPRVLTLWSLICEVPTFVDECVECSTVILGDNMDTDSVWS